MKLFWSFWSAIAMLTLSNMAIGDTKSDLALVKARTLELLTLGDVEGAHRTAVVEANDAWCEEFLSGEITYLVPSDWDEPEINYKVVDKAENWRRVAVAYRTKGSRFHGHEELLEPLFTGLSNILDYFNPDTPRPENWHPWLIVIPQNLGELGLLMEDALPPELLERLEVSLADELEEMRLNGANAAWEARNHAYLALIQEDPERLSRAARQVFRPVRYTYGSGVREDFSHMFHGHIPYAGGYGSGFAQTVSQFLVLFDKTEWAPRREKAELIANFLLEHALYYVEKGRIGMHIAGRGYEHVRTAGQLTESVLFMTEVDTPRRHELQAAALDLINNGAPVSQYVAHLADKLPDDLEPPDFKGFRYWYCSEMGVYKGDGFHIGFRQYSNRVQDYEFLTHRGAEGWNLPYGFTYITRNGREWYQDGLHPGLDMYYLPATTTRLGAHPVNDKTKLGIGDSGYSLNYGRSAFSGGAGYGDGGVAGFVLIPAYGDFLANKSLHFFPDGYWAVGSGIRSTASVDATGPVITPVLQWPLNDDAMIYLPEGAVAKAGDLPGPVITTRWLLVDGVGICFAEDTKINMEHAGGMLRVWLDHGMHPFEKGYAYAILPDTTLEELSAFASTAAVRPVEVTPDRHVVVDQKRGATSAVFFKGGSHADISVDHPAIIYRRLSGGESVYAVQNPLHTSQPLLLTGKVPGKITFPDSDVRLQLAEDNLCRFRIDTRSGRIYRFGSGKAGASVVSVPRIDMTDMRQFSVVAENSAEETLLHVTIPEAVQKEDFELTICGHRGHLLRLLTDEDIVARDGRVLTYRWDRALTDPDAFAILKQRSGDFRLYLRTELKSSIDYFTIPAYDTEGNVDAKAVLPWDNNNPEHSPRVY